jgi:predicted dehydrogenase
LFGFDYAWPVAVESRIHVSSPDGVPIDFSSAIYFDDKEEKKAYFHISFRQAFQQWVNFSGTNATLFLDDFVIPRSPQKVEYSLDSGDLNETHTCVIKREDAHAYIVENCSQETEMMRTFSEAVRSRKSGTKGLDPIWTRHVIQTQAVLDACLTSAKTNQRVLISKPDWC